MQVPFLDLTLQNAQFLPEFEKKLEEIFSESSFILGDRVEKFEAEFSKYIGIRHAIGVANGTDAVELAVRALGLPNNSQVIVPANSFIASALGVTRAGHEPIFCDNDDAYLIDLESAARVISEKTRAIIVVSLYGQLPNMDMVLDFAKKHNLMVIEDFAQAQGATYKGKMAGTFGHISATSFYPGKNLGAIGDAGCVVTEDSNLAKKVLALRNYGSTKKYHHPEIGFNSRLDALQSEFLRLKLRELDNFNRERQKIAELYLKNLDGIPELTLPRLVNQSRHVWHLFPVRSARRDELQGYLFSKGVQTLIHYPQAIINQGAYSHSIRDNLIHRALEFESQLLSLPIYPGMEIEQVEYVSQEVKSFFDS